MRTAASYADQSDPDHNLQFRRAWQTPTAEIERQRGCEHLSSLGPRALHGFLVDLEMKVGGGAVITRLLAEYRARLTPEMIQAAGADRFPPSVRGVP